MGGEMSVIQKPKPPWQRPTAFGQWQREIWVLLDDPASSTLAKVVSSFMMLVILLSIGSFTFASTPGHMWWTGVWSNITTDTVIGDSKELPQPANSYRSEGPSERMSEIVENREPFGSIETFCIMVFTVEYVLRLICSPAGPGGVRAFLKNVPNFIDLVSIMPWYIEIIFGGGALAVLSVLRLIRLTRIARIFKVSKNFDGLIVLFTTLRKSAGALVMLFLFMGIFSILFATLIYTFEMGAYDPRRMQYVRVDGSTSPFESIPSSLWWTIVTMTTVGYGDHYPVTPMGKMVAVLTMFGGLVVLSLPITIIGANFDLEYRERRKQKQEEMGRKRKEKSERLSTSRSGLGLNTLAAAGAVARMTAKHTPSLASSAGTPRSKADKEGSDAASEKPEEVRDPIKIIQKLMHESNCKLLREVDGLLMTHENNLRLQIKDVLRRHAAGIDLRPTPLEELKITEIR